MEKPRSICACSIHIYRIHVQRRVLKKLLDHGTTFDNESFKKETDRKREKGNEKNFKSARLATN